MARQKGANNFAGTLEPLAGGPLDARMTVPTKGDLTLSGNFPYPYVGMPVTVSDGKLYVLINMDYTKAESWVEVGGGASNVVEGYFNPSNNLFYKTKTGSTYSDPITGAAEVIYVALDISKTYRFNGTIFVRLDEEKTRVETLPTASANEKGNIYQYIGTTGSGLVNGYFYECVESTTTPGTYSWVQKNVQPDVRVDTLPSPTAAIKGEIVQYVGATSGGIVNGYFYKCVEDSTTPGTYKWEPTKVQDDSASGKLGKEITAVIDVGGISTGNKFTVGTSYDDMWNALLNPTLNPTLTDPSVSLDYDADTYYEVKSSIPTLVATETFNRGSISPAYGTSGYRSGEVTGYAIATSGADTEYSDSSVNSGTFNVPTLTRSTKGDVVLTATVSYAEGEQPKNSKGGNYSSPLAAGSKTASKTMKFIQAYFYGKSSTPTISNFNGLSKSVTTKGEKKFSFTTNNEYMVIAYDASYGDLKTILDPNSFDVTSGWTKSTLTVDGFNYIVYVANSRTTDTNAQFTFKY